jgi:hypothetical protein
MKSVEDGYPHIFFIFFWCKRQLHKSIKTFGLWRLRSKEIRIRFIKKERCKLSKKLASKLTFVGMAFVSKYFLIELCF